ncbi:hypothetical protein KBTX_01426 [wastewater metagenome]|uniref:ABC transporter substrate-binding protein n=2 Tax=unclassified sequences TaxID=12908 RepID=A0A5B8RED2_9ZZZZ|nr:MULTISPECIES: ABC transporter substrate-binding protein [Arhodomonas]QEA05107.1 hypothetical protein KBTEX_01426 [uncultured organism]
MPRRWILAAAVAACLVTLTTRAATGTGPVTLVREAVDEGLVFVRTHAATLADEPACTRAFIERHYRELLDPTLAARFVAGPYWADAPPGARTRFTRALTDHLVAVYATAVSVFAPRIVEFARTGDIGYRLIRQDGRRAVVRVALRPQDRRDVDVDILLHRPGERWLVHDARVAGISLLAIFRQAFRPRLAREGLAGVSDALERHRHAGGGPPETAPCR